QRVRDTLTHNLRSFPPVLQETLLNEHLSHISQHPTALWSEFKEEIRLNYHKIELLEKIEPLAIKTKKFEFTRFSKGATLHFTLRIGTNLNEKLKDLPIEIESIRKELSEDYGFSVPKIQIEVHEELDYSYEVFMKKIKLSSIQLHEHKKFAIPSPSSSPVPNVEATAEPAYGKMGYWVDLKDVNALKEDGYSIIDSKLLLSTHIQEILRNHLPQLFRWEEFNLYLEECTQQFPKLVKKIIPRQISRRQFYNLVLNLLREDISIQNKKALLYTLDDEKISSFDSALLTETVRLKLLDLSRFEEPIQYITLGKTLENILRQALICTPNALHLKLDPIIIEKLTQTLKALQKHPIQGSLVLITPPLIRGALQRTLQKSSSLKVTILSQAEVPHLEKYNHFATLSLSQYQLVQSGESEP
ncbi:MAG: FHIPEP family type III secretion protein, partial [Myxococcota bacterium]|nr:FHIPEP family type III secretion protein [Myxococcota bacterium]